MPPFIGIDFGTSNSTCAVSHNKSVSLVPLEQERRILPSVIFFAHDGQVSFGKRAIELYISGEEGRLLRGLKSILGTALMGEKTNIGRTSLGFDDILATYLRHIKQKADLFLKNETDNLVLGRPVHFHDNNPDADEASQKMLHDIATSIGFKNIHFQYEPIAAAYAHERHIQNEKIALVVDLGGGTSDFTIIRLSPQRALKKDRHDDILSTAGIRVGGTNFDKSFSVSCFMPSLGMGSTYHSEFDNDTVLTVPSKPYFDLSDWPLIHQAQTPQAIRETQTLLRTAHDPEALNHLLDLQKQYLGHAFLGLVEDAKIHLSDAQTYTSCFSSLGLDLKIQSTRDDLLDAIDASLKRIENAIDDSVTLAGCDHADINLVILTGGSSELPVINNMVKRKFPHAEISKDDKFGSVGKGLAHYADYLK